MTPEEIQEIARGIMQERARAVDRLWIKNDIGGHPALSECTDEEYEQIITDIADAIDQADITIEW